MSQVHALKISANSPPIQSPSEQNATKTPHSRNPFSLRLYKVLSTNFDDVATKEALQTLSDLYVSAPTTKGKETRSTHDAENLDENKEGSDSPRHNVGYSMEVTPGESAARARRNLRRDMENNLAEGSRQFLKALGEVDQRLLDLQEHVAVMKINCERAESQLKLTTEASQSLLDRAGNLRDERQEVEDKKSIVNLFLGKFTLSEDEVEALTSRDVSIGPRFFKAMDKTERIREDCRVLMAGENGPTKSGLDIMASTSSHLEQGYEKILRWCSNEFRQVAKDAHPEVSPIMREAVARLRTRQELLTEALKYLSETRQANLLSSFLTALTRGGPSGLPRPIELHAHDPMRYVGDMLAWVHQVIAGELEFLESLFGLKSDGRIIGSVRNFDTLGEEEEWIQELLDLSVAKLCVPLKLRVQQTIRSQESIIISYRIANLLQFYLMTMRRTIGNQALLSKTLQEITGVAYNVFYNSIEVQGRALLRVQLALDDMSLTPPAVIQDHMQILRETMAVYQSSLLGDENQEEQDAGFTKVLDIMVDPAVDMCITTSEEKKKARPKWDQAVYVLNCLTYIHNVMEPFSFTSQKQGMVQNVIDERVEQLISDHYQNIMSDAGIAEAAETCNNHTRDEPLSHIPSMQPPELQKALHDFSLWLSSLEVVQSTRLAQLTVQKLHAEIHQAALARMADAYKLICEEVRKPENRYEAASTLLGGERPFGQVHFLWQIFGLEDDDGRE